MRLLLTVLILISLFSVSLSTPPTPSPQDKCCGENLVRGVDFNANYSDFWEVCTVWIDNNPEAQACVEEVIVQREERKQQKEMNNFLIASVFFVLLLFDIFLASRFGKLEKKLKTPALISIAIISTMLLIVIFLIFLSVLL